MKPWSQFPRTLVSAGSVLYRIHRTSDHAAWFSSDGTGRFDPPPSYRARFGTCYLGVEPMTSYVEVFGRIRLVPRAEIDRRALSELAAAKEYELANLIDRSVLGDFGITGEHSTGSDYGPSQELAANLHDAGFDGIRYRIRRDPAMELEAVALFGEPGETPHRLGEPKTGPIASDLVEEARRLFRIDVTPSAPLP